MRYFDSGILLKLYFPEPNSAQATVLVREKGAPVLTALHRLEMKAAMAQRCGRGEITAAEHAQMFADFERDIAAGVFAVAAPPWPTVFAEAESLASAHAARNLCRSMDTLHVALAHALGATEFCTFDQRQAAMARAAGLTVVP